MSRKTVKESMSVAIVGAGLSGLMAGRRLQEQGRRVTLFDKGRRPGGRANTREHGSHRFDHGAQYFTVRDPSVASLLEGWLREGIVSEWRGTLVRIEGGGAAPAKEATRYVGVPGMISLSGHLARDLDVRAGVRIETLAPSPSGWGLRTTGGEVLGPFAQVIVAVPAPQAVPLLAPAPALQEAAAELEMDPCWAGMFVFQAPWDLGFDGAFLTDGPFSWMARNSSKPGRPAEEAWVVHARPDWTREHWEVERGAVADLMLQELRAAVGPPPEAVFKRAHRWGFALGEDRAPRGVLFDGEEGIGACGDWTRGGRVEGALLSGMEMAARLLR